MIFDIVIASIIGLFVGVIVNILADELPYRTFFTQTIKVPKDASEEERAEYAKFNALLVQRNRRGYYPVYPDGTPRPFIAWMGLSAFALGKRLPEHPQPDEIRSRGHREADGWTLSWRHPLTEIMTALLFGIAVYASGNIPDMNSAQYFLNFVYMAIFALIIAIDMEHKLILFIVMIPAIILGIIDAWLVSPPLPNLQDALLGGALGFGVFYSLYLLGFVFRWVLNRFAGRNITTVAFGYGDVMMMTLTGVLVGAFYTLVAIAVTTLLGALGALLYLITKAAISRTNASMTAIPYGPYIVLATIIVMFWGTDIYQWIIG